MRSALSACIVTFVLVACASSPPSDQEARVADLTVSSSAVAASSVTELSSSSPPPRDSLFLKCEGHDRAACVKLASHCRVGVTTEPKWESKECAERERRACDEGVGEYCSNLADRYSSVTGDVGVPKDEVTAVKLYDRACDLGDAGYNACTIAAYAYEAGNLGLPKDAARAVAIFEGLCEEDGGVFPQSCQSLARHLAEGDGVAKDEARAAWIHASACSQGACDIDAIDILCSDENRKAKTTVGCVARARVYMMAVAGAPAHDYRKAKSLLERACNRSEAAGCRMLAEWYAEGRDFPGGPKVPQDTKRAAALFAQACKAGDKAACRTP